MERQRQSEGESDREGEKAGKRAVDREEGVRRVTAEGNERSCGFLYVFLAIVKCVENIAHWSCALFLLFLVFHKL